MLLRKRTAGLLLWRTHATHARVARDDEGSRNRSHFPPLGSPQRHLTPSLLHPSILHMARRSVWLHQCSHE